MSDDNTDEQIGEETVETGAPDTSESKKDFDLDEIQESSSAVEEDDFEDGEAMTKDVTAIYDIPVQVSAVLGRSSM